MFQQYKLNKYADILVGFAYEIFEPRFFSMYGVQLYLVIDKDPGYAFVKYKKIRSTSRGNKDKIIKSLDARPMEYWIKLNSQKNDNHKKIVKIKDMFLYTYLFFNSYHWQ